MESQQLSTENQFSIQFPIHHSILSTDSQESNNFNRSPESSNINESSPNSNNSSADTDSNEVPELNNNLNVSSVQQTCLQSNTNVAIDVNALAQHSDVGNTENVPPNAQVFVFNEELHKIFMEMNPINASYYYAKCHNCNINEKQLLRLSKDQISRIFDDNEVGIWADFETELEEWKNKQQFKSNISSRTYDELIFENSIPNSLFNILKAGNLPLYRKAIQVRTDDSLKTLNGREQNILLTLVKNHFLDHGCKKMSYEDMECIAEEIVRYFPGESKDTYFKREIKIYHQDNKELTRSRVSGKLFNKWNNRSDRSSLGKQHNPKVALCYSIPIEITEITNEDDQEKIRVNLAANLNYSIHLILDEWKRSKELRFKCIQNNLANPHKIFNNWPFYGQTNGYFLVCI